MTFKSLLLMLLMTLGLSAHANTYYVSPAGSDSATGTSATPWKTITHAAQVAVAGDTVNIEAGTYAEGSSLLLFSNSGTKSAPITFIGADPQVKPGPGAETPNTVITSAGVEIDGDYVTLSYVKIQPLAGKSNFGDDNSAGVGMYGTGDEIYRCISTGWSPVIADHMALFVLGGTSDVVSQCYVHDLNDIAGFHAWGSGHQILWNYVSGLVEANGNISHDDFFQTWGSASGNLYLNNCLIFGNYFVNSPTCTIGDSETDGSNTGTDANLSGPWGVWVVDNIFVNDLSWFAGTPNYYFYGNLWKDCGQGGGVIYFETAPNPYTSVYSDKGSQVANNAFVGNTANGGIDIDTLTYDPSSGNTNTGTPDISTLGLAEISNNYFATDSFGAVSNGEYQGTNPITGGNPEWVAASRNPFNIQAGSVFLTRGLNLTSQISPVRNPPVDANNTAEPATGAWQIGPYQAMDR